MLKDKLADKKIILASKSPRRQELLKGLDIDFEIRLKEIEEIYPPSLVREEVPVYLAELKAQPFKESLKDDEILLTSDTVVCLNDKILGKPRDEHHATEILSQLSGNMHEVITGVCLTSNTKSISFHSITSVYFKSLSKEEIQYYLTNYQPYDKAGSYGVQEWIGYTAVEKIEGSFYNVMGLPVKDLYDTLINF